MMRIPIITIRTGILSIIWITAEISSITNPMDMSLTPFEFRGSGTTDCLKDTGKPFLLQIGQRVLQVAVDCFNLPDYVTDIGHVLNVPWIH
jgi:hypothetical protein